MTSLDDTIVAIATPAGKGAIAIVRLSGSRTREIAAKFVRSRAPLEPRVATNVAIDDSRGSAIDRGLAILFVAPQSYTGEDLLELHVHGSPVVARETVMAALQHGARLAEPGEFTRRAFLNGKLDLNEAVAVADLIDAETQSAARAAVANLTPAITNDVRAMRARLAEVLEELAGAIDFPEEVPDPDRARVCGVLDDLTTQLEALLRDAELGRLVREGVNVAIVGPPNAGKSSLLNALLGEERAIVSEIPGTTRDTIEERIVVEGVPVRLVDTAGIRAHADRLEAEGIARSRRALESARIALVVLDGSQPLGAPEREILAATEGRMRVVFLNKADLGVSFDCARFASSAQDDKCARFASSAQDDKCARFASSAQDDVVTGSVRDAQTIAQLKAAIAKAGWDGERPDLERPHLAALYELDAVREAREALGLAQATLDSGEPPDLIAGELQRAFSALGHVTERIAAEEVLDGVFSRFCIGK